MRLTLGLWLLFSATLLAEPTAAWHDQRLTLSGVSSSTNIRVVVAIGTTEAIAQRPAVTGDWKAAGKNAFDFQPKYPLQAGTKYRVFFDGDKSFADVSIPDTRDKTPPVLQHVFPSGDTIPENTLRFYLVFSKPMSRGEAYARVKFLDENGKAVVQPFLELDEELWNLEQTRLTLLIDPGRIKQEVKPRLDLGPVFHVGKKYTLVVDGKWLDAAGVVMGNDWRRAITAGPAITKAPTPSAWKLLPPAKPGEALTVTFPKAMDEALLRNHLTVQTDDGQPVTGTITVEKGETVWRFTPEKPWKIGGHHLRLTSRLEDVAGNAIDQPFELEETAEQPKKPAAVTLIPFAVAGR